MKFIDLGRQQQKLQPGLDRRLARVLEHGQYIMGPEVQELEQVLAAYVGVEHCVAVSSGTDALLIALMALDVGTGDEVVTTPFTFVATVETIRMLGARPVYVDIDPRTYNMDPAHLEQAIGDRTRAIVGVSLYGQCADYDTILDIAGKHGIPVIEDAAQSFGASYKGRRSCGLTDIGCTSFFPSKPLGAYGDGGACFTADAGHAARIRCIRDHGQTGRYRHDELGINGRLDTLQAAVLLAKMELFDEEITKRESVAGAYAEAIKEQLVGRGLPPDAVKVPFVTSECGCVYAQYTVQVENRDQVQRFLAAEEIPVAVHYPTPVYHQKAYLEKVSCPRTEAVCERVLSLPMHPYLEQDDIDRVAERLVAVVAAADSQTGRS